MKHFPRRSICEQGYDTSRKDKHRGIVPEVLTVRTSASVKTKPPFNLVLRSKVHQDRAFSPLHLLEFCESSLSLSPKQIHTSAQLTAAA